RRSLCLRCGRPPPRLFPYTTLFRSCSGEVLRNARNQMDLCKEQRKGNEGQPVAVAPATRQYDRFSVQLFRDQRPWLAEKLAGSRDRKSTRLNSSHVKISYAVFCLKK